MANHEIYQWTAGFVGLLLLAGCQGSQVYTSADIGPAPFLVNAAPVAYSRIDEAPAPVPIATTVQSQPIYAEPTPQPLYINEPDIVRMAEPVVETVVYSDPVPQTIVYDDTAITPTPISYDEPSPLLADPVYSIESEKMAQDGIVYIDEVSTVAEQPVQSIAEPIPAFPSPPAGIEVEFIAPPTVAAPTLPQPGVTSYGTAL